MLYDTGREIDKQIFLLIFLKQRWQRSMQDIGELPDIELCIEDDEFWANCVHSFVLDEPELRIGNQHIVRLLFQLMTNQFICCPTQASKTCLPCIADTTPHLHIQWHTSLSQPCPHLIQNVSCKRMWVPWDKAEQSKYDILNLPGWWMQLRCSGCLLTSERKTYWPAEYTFARDHGLERSL